MKKKLFFSLLLSSIALPVLSADDQELIETLQVTGSRLKQIDIEGAMPLTVFEPSDFELYGASTLGDFFGCTK